MADFAFQPVRSVQEASRLLAENPPPHTMLMAGGTDLLPLRRHRLLAPRAVVYLKGLKGDLAAVRPNAGGLVIGALVTLSDLARHPLVSAAYPMLAQAALSVGSAQVRNKATLGGNLCLNTRCWFYNRSPFWRSEYPDCRKAAGGSTCYVLPESRQGCFALQSGDTVGPLVALGARLRLVSGQGERMVAVEDFYRDDGIRNLDLQPGEILTEVLLPAAPARGGFLKHRLQNNLDFAAFTLSVRPPGEDSEARIVVASVAGRPLRARRAEEILSRTPTDVEGASRAAAQELRLVSFVRGPVEYKRQAIRACLARILSDLNAAVPGK